MRQITIRLAEPTDAAALYEMHKDFNSYANTLQMPYSSRKFWEQRLSQNEALSTRLVAVVEGVVVGLLGINQNSNPRRRHVVSFGITVDKSYRGQGIGSTLMQAMIDYCDNWLDIRRIELEVFANNPDGMALYEKFGFQREGIARDYAFRDGRYVDAIIMSRISNQAR
ncbi:GNAT family N-acetyltransferase [Morganella psychrotolerans]|uniref:GNAT family acetyltransferase n=1 Tax=Morganella psychrotolerans TaxID=368603 RepID=A0A1B8HE75_9GAMM|nr:GNAT family N-acetyltransferase [Morganella psychrotolerans]OBU07384.1 GNAT family acetyltransferase [Morganella psychrotolerans]